MFKLSQFSFCHRKPKFAADTDFSIVRLATSYVPPIFLFYRDRSSCMMPPLKYVLRSLDILRYSYIRLVDATCHISMVARGLVVRVLLLVPVVGQLAGVGLEDGEGVDGGAVLLDTLHVLELDGVVELETHVVVNPVGVIHNVALGLEI